MDQSEKRALEILNEAGAVMTNSHFVYASGRHGRVYVNKDAVYPHTAQTSRLCAEIAKRFQDDDVEVVIAPAIGGVILSQWTAWHLTELPRGREVLGVYAEKAEGDTFVIKRGYDRLIAGKNVLVVEDVLTTGGSARKVIEVTRAFGGEVVGLGALCNRGGVTPEDLGGVPKLHALVNVTLDTWSEEECLRNGPCSEGVPINIDVGKGREFLARKKSS